MKNVQHPNARNALNVRKACQITQAEAARLLDVHYSIISKFESGNADMSVKLVRKLAGIYSEILRRPVSMEELMLELQPAVTK